MAQLIVVAKVVAKQEAVEALKMELIKLIEPTRKENGCMEYRLQQDNEDPAVFIFFETWQSRECLDRHMNSSHFQQYIKNTDGMIAEKAVHLMTSVDN